MTNASRFGFFLIAFFTLVTDQISKWAVMEHWLRPVTGQEPTGLWTWLMEAPAKLPPILIEVLPFYNTVVVWNYGISFGLFNDGDSDGSLILITLSSLVSAAFLIWLLNTNSRMTALSLALVIGGAAGNIIDRVRFGAVFDFADFHIAGYHWPAFNFADSAIVVGVVILLIHSLFFEKNSSESV